MDPDVLEVSSRQKHGLTVLEKHRKNLIVAESISNLVLEHPLYSGDVEIFAQKHDVYWNGPVFLHPHVPGEHVGNFLERVKTQGNPTVLLEVGSTLLAVLMQYFSPDYIVCSVLDTPGGHKTTENPLVIPGNYTLVQQSRPFHCHLGVWKLCVYGLIN